MQDFASGTGGEELTPKAQRTKERILEAALGLFTEKGYEATTMRDIAERAEASLGLAYRYYASKEGLALALYMLLAEELSERAHELPAGTVAERFEETMRIKLELVRPYREPLGAVLAKALDPNSPIAALGSGTSMVREKVSEVFLEVVWGARDAPGEKQARELANVLNAMHLAILLYWFHDSTPDARATFDLVSLARDALRLLKPALRLSPAARTLSRLTSALGSVRLDNSGAGTDGTRR